MAPASVGIVTVVGIGTGQAAGYQSASPPFDDSPLIAVSWEHKLARRCCKHPGPWRHLNKAGDANRLYYSQTRSRQEAGLF